MKEFENIIRSLFLRYSILTSNRIRLDTALNSGIEGQTNVFLRNKLHTYFWVIDLLVLGVSLLILSQTSFGCYFWGSNSFVLTTTKTLKHSIRSNV